MIGHVGCVASIKLLTYETCRLNPIHSMLFSIYFLYCSLYIQQYISNHIDYTRHLVWSHPPDTAGVPVPETSLENTHTHTHLMRKSPFPKLAWTRLDIFFGRLSMMNSLAEYIYPTGYIIVEGPCGDTLLLRGPPLAVSPFWGVLL